MTLLIAMDAPWLPDGDDVRGAAGLPDLPALGRLLRHSRRLPVAADWRAGVLAALGGDPATAPAAVAAHAIAGIAPHQPLCLAAPLHVVAGLSRVHLPPGGRLVPEASEEEAWCAEFNREFGSSQVQLHVATPGGHWLLAAPFAQGARDDAPEALEGEPLRRVAARDTDERALRRLGSEVEMWLSDHALNRAREARGLPAVNALWFWGGARAAVRAPLAHAGLYASNLAPDAWLAGLARQGAAQARRLERWEQLVASGASAENALVVLMPSPAEPAATFWQHMEQDWFAPLQQALAAEQLPALRLQIGGSAWQWPRRSLLRHLSLRRAPWWQLTGQARP
jgi:hypothetical protein